MRWVILTGEYPPMVGGVSDYTQLVARGLAQCGDEVHIWCPACEGADPGEPGVRVHHIPTFGPGGLRKLSAGLERMARPYEILVQYVPHAFGWKAMNLPFCAWLYSRRREHITVMFHEAVFPLARRQPVRHNVLGVVSRVMAAILLGASERNFISVPAWRQFLERLHPRAPLEWLPVPANMNCSREEDASAVLRQRIAADRNTCVVGHFGTFGRWFRATLTRLLPPILAGDRRMCLLIGQGSTEFASELERQHPELRGRLHSTGTVSADVLGPWLGAADILIQPYPDGASSRRSSLMAGLSVGLPIVTNEGPATEPLWKESSALRFACADSPEGFASAAEELLADGNLRRTTGQNALALYAERFAIRHTIGGLRQFRPNCLA
jgi:glycosyltransferase involved in cell wall biosynthesis